MSAQATSGESLTRTPDKTRDKHRGYLASRNIFCRRGFAVLVDAFQFVTSCSRMLSETCQAQEEKAGADDPPPPAMTIHYYLSHYHSDHYVGLNRSFSAGKLLCSEANARMVTGELGVAAEFVFPLAFGRLYYFSLVDGAPLQEGDAQALQDRQYYTVRLVSANHCPAAAMLLFFFAPTNTTVVHTGDFRYNGSAAGCPSAVDRQLFGPFIGDDEHVRALRKKTDVLFLDNTYCLPTFDFAPQWEAVARVADEIRRLLKEAQEGREKDSQGGRPLRMVVLVGSYTVGKERLALGLQRQLCGSDCAPAPIAVSPAKHALLKTLDYYASRFEKFRTTESGEVELPTTPISGQAIPATMAVALVPLRSVSYRGLLEASAAQRVCVPVEAGEAEGWVPLGGYDLVVGVEPSGWKRKARVAPVARRVRAIQVPYSEHSTFTELLRFVGLLNPAKVIPTVSPEQFKEHEALFLERAPRLRGTSSLPITRFFTCTKGRPKDSDAAAREGGLPSRLAGVKGEAEGDEEDEEEGTEDADAAIANVVPGAKPINPFGAKRERESDGLGREGVNRAAIKTDLQGRRQQPQGAERSDMCEASSTATMAAVTGQPSASAAHTTATTLDAWFSQRCCTRHGDAPGGNDEEGGDGSDDDEVEFVEVIHKRRARSSSVVEISDSE